MENRDLQRSNNQLVKRSRWVAPVDPTAQALKLRDMLRQGRNMIVAYCEYTHIEGNSLITCQPDNCDEPCWNCKVLIYTGRKNWPGIVSEQ